MKLLERDLGKIELVPGIYLHSRSGLVNIWFMNVDFQSEAYPLTHNVMDNILHTLYSYLSQRYGKYRILGVCQSPSRKGFYIFTRFISNHMIFGAVIDYIMELQCETVNHVVDRTIVHELSVAKEYMLLYYDKYLRYQSSAMKYKK